MKIISRSLKEQRVKLRADVPEDLWHIERVLEAGDIVTSRTMRKVSVKRGGEYEYAEKKPMVLTLKAEKIEFQKDSGILRVTGPILEGPDDIQKQSYHSIQIDVGSVVTIEKKKWKPHEIERLEKARVRKPMVLICVLDREEADFAVLRESGIEMKAGITNYDKENMEEFYKQIVSYLRKQDYVTFVLAGPGFERENLLKFITKNHRDLAGKIITEHSSSTGINGVSEVVKKSASRILKESRISRESEYVEEILKRMKTGGMVAYGQEETGKAVNMGAVETLFVSQEKLRDFEKLMETQEKMRGRIAIIGADHELGEQFLHIGGIAGFLRFRTGSQD